MCLHAPAGACLNSPAYVPGDYYYVPGNGSQYFSNYYVQASCPIDQTSVSVCRKLLGQHVSLLSQYMGPTLAAQSLPPMRHHHSHAMALRQQHVEDQHCTDVFADAVMHMSVNVMLVIMLTSSRQSHFSSTCCCAVLSPLAHISIVVMNAAWRLLLVVLPLRKLGRRLVISSLEQRICLGGIDVYPTDYLGCLLCARCPRLTTLETITNIIRPRASLFRRPQISLWAHR